MAGVLTREQKQLALRLRNQGLSLVAIARQVGCSAPMNRVDGARREVPKRGA